MKYGIIFALVALFLVTVAGINRGGFLMLLWPSLSFATVALAYFYLGARVYGKSSRGLLSPINVLLLFPYLLYLWSLWYIIRLIKIIKREPAYNQLTENIFIGRRLLSHELPNKIDCVIDLTCEFNEPKTLRLLSYYSFPILDGFVPSAEELRRWGKQVANMSGNIYIHCAEGRGRTGLFAAVVLFYLGRCQTVDAALDFIKSKRSLVRLGYEQLALVRQIYHRE